MAQTPATIDGNAFLTGDEMHGIATLVNRLNEVVGELKADEGLELVYDDAEFATAFIDKNRQHVGYLEYDNKLGFVFRG